MMLVSLFSRTVKCLRSGAHLLVGVMGTFILCGSAGELTNVYSCLSAMAGNAQPYCVCHDQE